MCGLVGVAGTIQIKHENMFKDMLRLDVVRGSHSTGIAAVTGTKEVLLAKKAMLPEDLLGTREAGEIFKKNLKVLIGHNRYATVGGVTAANAHPFELDNVVGAHNGTVQKYKLPNNTQFKVDSENVFHSIGTIGLDKTIPKLDGKFALTWYDEKTSLLNIIRNKERPLFLAFAKDTDTVMWASEPWMLTVAAARNGVELRNNEVLDTAIGTHYTLNPYGSVKAFKSVEKDLTLEHRGLLGAHQSKKSESGSKSSNANSQENKSDTDINKIPFTDAEVGDLVDFTVDEVFINTFTKYAVGTVWGKAFKVRMYFPEGTAALQKEMQGETKFTYRGEIAGYRCDYDGDDYVIVDAHTAEAVAIGANDEEYLSNGVFIKKAEFLDDKITDPDCQWCGSPLLYANKPTYAGRYNGKRGHVCADCEELEEVRDYLRL